MIELNHHVNTTFDSVLAALSAITTAYREATRDLLVARQTISDLEAEVAKVQKDCFDLQAEVALLKMQVGMQVVALPKAASTSGTT